MYDINYDIIKLIPWELREIGHTNITIQRDEWFKMCMQNGLQIAINIYGE